MERKKIYFQKEKDSFFQDLKSEIDSYFSENKLNTTANGFFYAKAILFTSVYILSYISIYVFGDNIYFLFLIYPFIGIWGVFLGLNVGHDAAHNAVFKKRKYNFILLHVFDLLGTNS